MEKNHNKITEHRRKYNTIYSYYFLSYIVVIALSLLLNAPALLIPLLMLVIIHIITRCVDVVEMDDLKRKELFDNLKGKELFDYLKRKELFEDLKDRHP